MNRFTAFAGIFAALALCLGYEAARATIHAIEALVGIGIPRTLPLGLLSLCVAALTFYLAWGTLRVARTQLQLRRMTKQRQSGPAA